jgi:hypothetical protein
LAYDTKTEIKKLIFYFLQVQAVSALVEAIGRNKNDSFPTTPEPPVMAVSELVKTLSQHGQLGDILRNQNQGGFGTNGSFCVLCFK